MLHFKHYFLYPVVMAIAVQSLHGAQGTHMLHAPQNMGADASQITFDQQNPDTSWDELITESTPFYPGIRKLIYDYMGYTYTWQNIARHRVSMADRRAPFGCPVHLHDEIVLLPSQRSITSVDCNTGLVTDFPIISQEDVPYHLNHDPRIYRIVPVSREEVFIVIAGGTTSGIIKSFNMTTHQLSEATSLFQKQGFLVKDIAKISNNLFAVAISSHSIKQGYAHTERQLSRVDTIFDTLCIWNKQTDSVIDTLKSPNKTNFSALAPVTEGLFLGLSDGLLMHYDPSGEKQITCAQISKLPTRKAAYGIKQIVALSDSLIAILEDALPINFVHTYNVQKNSIVTSFPVQSIGLKHKPRALIPVWHHKRIVVCYKDDDWMPKISQCLETFDTSGHFMDQERMPPDDHVIPLNNRVLSVNNCIDGIIVKDQFVDIYALKPKYAANNNDEYQPNPIRQIPDAVQNPVHRLCNSRGRLAQYTLAGASLALGCLSAYRWYRNSSPREVCITAATSLTMGLAAIKLYNAA